MGSTSIDLTRVLSASQPAEATREVPASYHYRRAVGRPKTIRGYRPMFEAIVTRYIECKLQAQSPVLAEGSPSEMLTMYNYIIDTEQLATRVLNTSVLWSAWCNLVRRHSGQPWYIPIPGDLERTVIETICREWEHLDLSKMTGHAGSNGGALRDVGTGKLIPESRPKKTRVRHGKSKTPEYRIWRGMLARCYNPKATGYQHYGGRGIKVAPEFLDFETFLSEVGPRPGDDYTLDRIDNNGDYAPGNVRWVTRKVQNANRRPPCDWPSRKLKAAGWPAEMTALSAARTSCQRRFDEEYLKAVKEQESETEPAKLIDWQASKTRYDNCRATVRSIGFKSLERNL